MQAFRWQDTGSATILAEGSSLKDSSSVLAKIAEAQTNASVNLEREADILQRLAAAKTNCTLRMLEFIHIPKEAGNCIVLLLTHPGINILGRYLPPSRVNDLLLADNLRTRSSSSHGDSYMKSIDSVDIMDGLETYDCMDLSTFLEFAIQATLCLEAIHKANITHREIRANAFHQNSHTDAVRLVHFGNRSVSLEYFGSPSPLVLRADEAEKMKIKEALCYLAPEQTGAIETNIQDHRTDLYSLGILFWTLAAGTGRLPFEGDALELLHSVVQQRPMPVHDVNRNVPQVLASIIDKLLEKNPDSRYQSAHGLRCDLVECQRRLTHAVASSSDHSPELISPFEIGREDRFWEFTMPLALFGREKELELIKNVVRRTCTSYSQSLVAKKHIVLSSSTSHEAGTVMNEDSDTSGSIRSNTYGDASDAARSSVAHDSPAHEYGSNATSISPSMVTGSIMSDGARRKLPVPKSRPARSQVVVVTGPPGVGKSSLILANQAKWRSHGLWGQAKFQNNGYAPFSAILSCLSSILRQLWTFQSDDLSRFVESLKERLGPQIHNAPLLYQLAPELKDILESFNIHLEHPKEELTSRELRARFQSLVENVFAVVAETRLLGIFLDDLHEADESTLDLVSSLVISRSRMLIFMTVRSDKPEVVDRVRSMFDNRSKPTWINVEPLSFSAVSSLVSRTLHVPKDECSSLARFVFESSFGNAFSARNILTTLRRQHHIVFDWQQNCWQYNMAGIEASMAAPSSVDPTDISFIISNFQNLPDEAKKYLTWATFLGETFKLRDVTQMMTDWEDSNGSSGSDEDDEKWTPAKAAMMLADKDTNGTRSAIRGLQLSLSEGWIVQRARDMGSFAHDRYRQAAQNEAQTLSPEVVSKMAFRIVLMMMTENPMDVYRIAEHAKRCLPLLREHPKHDELFDIIFEAGESAWARGAHELARQSFESARLLLREDPWKERPHRTFELYHRLAAIFNWSSDWDQSNAIISECLVHARLEEQQASLYHLKSRNSWLQSMFSNALDDTLHALRLLGIEMESSPSRKTAMRLFDDIKNEILAVGYDEIIRMPRATDARTDLAVSLLNDAGINAYWSPSPSTFSDMVGMKTISLALRNGMSPGTALGFFWALGAAADRRDLYRFATDLAVLALKLADIHGTASDKCRAAVLYCAMVSGFTNVHLRANIPKLEEAIKYGEGAGDRLYTSFASIYAIMVRLFVCENLVELVNIAEDCLNDVMLWTPGADTVILAQGVINCIRAITGYCDASSSETAFNTDTFDEVAYVEHIKATTGNVPLVLSWYNAFKVVGYFCLGFPEQAASMGFSVYETRNKHPNHRHVRYSLFFHSLAMIACIRTGKLVENTKSTYFTQIKMNQDFIKKWQSPSPINTNTWLAIVDAEMAALKNDARAFKLYDRAYMLSVQDDWPLEEGWALYLQGSHFVRSGVIGLGGELQRRGISRFTQIGAQGIVNNLSSTTPRQYPRKRSLFTSDVAVQTESIAISAGAASSMEEVSKSDGMEAQEGEESMLSAADLASILKWSKEISSDFNLSTALQRLTEIVTETTGSHNTCVVIARDGGDYTVYTSMTPPGRCQVYEIPRSIRAITDPLQKTIIQHTLNSKERLTLDDASMDSRFSSEARQSASRSAICLPIFGNRGQTYGAVYVASKYPFSQAMVARLSLLCQQASISVSNALLFREGQAGTRENLKRIQSQKEALEDARQSREDALKATKTKSNFLASMSHELRTPFSSFYGLLDLLSGTELNSNQSSIVQTAKQSCELLLKIIDSILDYSKLEASALKLELSGFLVEDIIGDCLELLLPIAAKTIDLAFNIEPDVPQWVFADYARIRQILMNLIGNAVKFTSRGHVHVTCSVENTTNDEVTLKFSIQDTGIGLSPADTELLFRPFQQADGSTTRKFGGTGLGLSISRQLVKLMNGVIGVDSQLHVGSNFWFRIPVKIYTGDETKHYTADINRLRLQLTIPRPLNIVLCSASKVTLSMLQTMLTGFNVTALTSNQDIEAILRDMVSAEKRPDFMVVDDQDEAHVQELVKILSSLTGDVNAETKIIHMYTPTTNVPGQSVFGHSTPGVVKMTKPPRLVRLLQALSGLKYVPVSMSKDMGTVITKAMDDIAAAKRTLFGNVLIAEDNVVARNLLIKQLQKYQLNVVATTNGQEAIDEWQTREPGFFSVALFDHHMPICDGVEAAKRLRMIENKRKLSIQLPIVALSADCQDTTKQLCLSAGMNAFFSKPLKKNDLASLLSSFGHSPAVVTGS